MNIAHRKANVGIVLVTLTLVTAVTGIILHLKRHGLIIEPRQVIKMIHWIAGYLMAAIAIWHYAQFRLVLRAMKKSLPWFRAESWILAVVLAATVITGAVKMFSPVRIPHLGLWHYNLGLAMTALAIIHLVRGLPCWWRLHKSGRAAQ